MKQVFVMGSGVMGRGIAQVAATSGYEVTLYDVLQTALKSALDTIGWSLGKLKEKGKIQEEPEKIQARISTVTELTDVEKAEIVIEAIPENRALKEKLFQELDQRCGEHTLLASNTSAIPITELACATKRREKVVGLHFFNPVPMMNMVEIVRGQDTSDETIETAKSFVTSLGKKYCLVQRDVAGFVMNRIGICSSIEAIRILEEGVATVEEIDQGMRMAYGWSMGPLETFDLSGLDVALNAALAIYEETQDPKFLPPVTLRRLVASGNLGRKTGKGFYDYTLKK